MLRRPVQGDVKESKSSHVGENLSIFMQLCEGEQKAAEEDLKATHDRMTAIVNAARAESRKAGDMHIKNFSNSESERTLAQAGGLIGVGVFFTLAGYLAGLRTHGSFFAS
mmetsp:Transcript_3001/g.5757  ORF Transcript_3001/g.5757 Transcript_3001/m.5757 type:complete len:110 (-) Transcript_3001:255-584(-)